MKTISTDLKNHLQGEVTTIANCWKITRPDAVVMGFTDHDKDLVIDFVAYSAQTGFTPSAVQSSASFAVDNLDLDGMIDSSAITEEDIEAGKYDFAEVEIFQVNYEDVSQGRVWLRRGWIGEVSYGRGLFVAEVRGLMQKLSQKIGDVFSPLCRATLGDAKCGVDLASFTQIGTITSVQSRLSFADSARTEEAGYFNFGKITFTSGGNNTISMEVKEFRTDGSIKLVLPLPYDVQVGDSYNIIAGCDKNFDTCISKFSNAVNFRGEPHVPGTDEILKTSTTR